MCVSCPRCASAALCEIFRVTASCSSTAAEIAEDEFSTFAMKLAILSILVLVWLARAFTPDATTANPLPASPARAASIVAFSASRLVCSAMSLIRLTTPVIFSAAWLRASTVYIVLLAVRAASTAAELDSEAVTSRAKNSSKGHCLKMQKPGVMARSSTSISAAILGTHLDICSSVFISNRSEINTLRD